jgi:methylthioribose-1-phosphate isomerase
VDSRIAVVDQTALPELRMVEIATPDELCGPVPLRLHTHCTAGALACVEYGGAIEAEERAGSEVLAFRGSAAPPAGSEVWNPAFDVAPADLVTAIVPEERVWRPGA